MIQQLVSRTRRRWVDSEFNLDLSYICEKRIIAMSFPGNGFIETQYRNDCIKVGKFQKSKF